MRVKKFMKTMTFRYLVIPYFVMLLILVPSYFTIFNQHTQEQLHHELSDMNTRIKLFLDHQVKRSENYIKRDILKLKDKQLNPRKLQIIIQNFMFNNELLYDGVGFISPTKNLFYSSKKTENYDLKKILAIKYSIISLKRIQKALLSSPEQDPFNKRLKLLILNPVSQNNIQKGYFVFSLHLNPILDEIFYSFRQRLKLKKTDYKFALFNRKSKEKIFSSALNNKIDKLFTDSYLSKKNQFRISGNKYYLSSLFINYLNCDLVIMVKSKAISSFHHQIFLFFLIVLILFSAFFILLYNRASHQLNKQFKQFYEVLRTILESNINNCIESKKAISQIKIFEFKEILDEVSNLRKQLSQTLEKDKELIAFIAHDLLSPLSYITMGLQLLEEDPSNQEIKDAVMMGAFAVKEMASNFLIFSKMDKSKVELKKSSQKFSDWLNLLEKKYTGFAKLKNLNFTMLCNNRNNFIVETDFEKLNRILDNLFFNALKHTQEGEIVLTVSPNEEKQKFFLQMKDSGDGIPEDLKENLFKEFTKGEKQEGSGLGLYITQLFINMLKGRIEVCNFGKGACFNITIPVDISKNYL